MACSKPFDFERIIDLTRCKSVLRDFFCTNNVLFNFNGLCNRCHKGQLYLRHDKSAAGGLMWRCSNKLCYCKIPSRKHSNFSGSHLSLSVITKIIYFWTQRYPQEIVIFETGLSNHSVIDFYIFFTRSLHYSSPETI